MECFIKALCKNTMDTKKCRLKHQVISRELLILKAQGCQITINHLQRIVIEETKQSRKILKIELIKFR
jgi:hypothetical protein